LKISNGEQAESPGSVWIQPEPSWMLLERETLSHEGREGKRSESAHGGAPRPPRLSPICEAVRRASL